MDRWTISFIVICVFSVFVVFMQNQECKQKGGHMVYKFKNVYVCEVK